VCETQPEPKSTKKMLSVLTTHFAYLSPKSPAAKANAKDAGLDELVGEYQSLMEQEFFDFVMFEVPWIVY
jgi:V-type H+-transporting ATPase subunit C